MKMDPQQSAMFTQQLQQVITPDRVAKLSDPGYLMQVAQKLAMAHAAPDEESTNLILQHLQMPQQQPPPAQQPAPPVPAPPPPTSQGVGGLMMPGGGQLNAQQRLQASQRQGNPFNGL